MRILLDAYNLVLTEGTGIATYARNLSHAISELGHQPEVLYQFRRLGRGDKLLDELSFYDQQSVQQYMSGGSVTRISRASLAAVYGVTTLASRVVGRKHRAWPVQLGSYVITRGIQSRLPSFDRIWTAPFIFQKASRYFALTGKFLPVKIHPTPDIAHWTLPFPIYVPGAKNIYTIHDVVPLRLPYTTIDNRKRYLNLIKRTVERADHLIVISETTKRDILEIAPEAEGKVTNTFQSLRPYEHPKASSDAVQKLFGLRKNQYFLFVSAIEPKKNVGRLIQAFLASNSRYPLIIVGRKAWLYQKELAPLKYLDVTSALGNKSPRGGVITVDYMDYNLLVALIKSARALLFPSLYEGFGLPILEAMELGTPVMTSNVGSMAEIAVPGTAALVDPYDIEQMSETIARLSEESEYCKGLSTAGLERAKAFSWDVYKNCLSDVYQRVGG